MAAGAERLKDFRIKNLLGKGAFGDVYKVQRISDGKTYALKKINIASMDTREVGDTLNEIRFLASIRHPNVVGFMEAFLNERSLEICVVMEFADGGDLAGKVEKAKQAKRHLDENLIWAYFIQLCDGLQALHSKRIIHRDIKTANLFLTADGHLKIGDLNVSKLIKQGLVKTQIGTPYYMSPEIWRNRPYDYKSDMWSVGCVLYELCALHPPFRGTDIEDLSRKVQAGFYPKIPSHFSSELGDLIRVLLSQDPRKRPTIDELLANPIITRRRAALSSVMDSTLKAAIALEEDVDFLGTIAVPKNIKRLTHQLPAPCYPDARPASPRAWPVTDPRRAIATARERDDVPRAGPLAAAGGSAVASSAPTPAPSKSPSSTPAGGAPLPILSAAQAAVAAARNLPQPAPVRSYSDPAPSSRPSVPVYGGYGKPAPAPSSAMGRGSSAAALQPSVKSPPPKYGYRPSPLPTVMEGGPAKPSNRPPALPLGGIRAAGASPGQPSRAAPSVYGVGKLSTRHRKPSGLFTPSSIAGEGDSAGDSLLAHFKTTLRELGLDAKDVDALSAFCFGRRISSAAFRVLYHGLLLLLKGKETSIPTEEPPVPAKVDTQDSNVPSAAQRRMSLPVYTRMPSGRISVKKSPLNRKPSIRNKYYGDIGVLGPGPTPSLKPVDAFDSTVREDTEDFSVLPVKTDWPVVPEGELAEVDPSVASAGTDDRDSRPVSPASPPRSVDDEIATEEFVNATRMRRGSETVGHRPRSVSNFDGDLQSMLPVDVFINCADDAFRQDVVIPPLIREASLESVGISLAAMQDEGRNASEIMSSFAPLPLSGVLTGDTPPSALPDPVVLDLSMEVAAESVSKPLVGAAPPRPIPFGRRRVLPKRLESDRGPRRAWATYDQLKRTVMPSGEADNDDGRSVSSTAATGRPHSLSIDTSAVGAETTLTSLSQKLQRLWAGDASTPVGAVAPAPPYSSDLDAPYNSEDTTTFGRTQADVARDLIQQGLVEEAVPFLEKAASALATEGVFSPPGSSSVPQPTPRGTKKPKQSSVHTPVLGQELDEFDEYDDESVKDGDGALQRRQKRASDRNKYRVQVAHDLMKCSRQKDAVPLYLQVLWEEPKNPEVLWGLATHYIREGHVPMAMAQLSQLIAMFPKCPDVLLAHCRALVFNGEMLVAIKLLCAAIDDTEVLVSTRPSSGGLEPCQILHDTSTHVAPCDLYLLLGELFALTHHHRKAVACFEAARKLVPCGWPLAVAYEAVSLASANEDWIPQALERTRRLQRDLNACKDSGILVTYATLSHPALLPFPQAMKPVCYPRDPTPSPFPSSSYLCAMEAIASRCSLRLCQIIALSSDPVAALPLLNVLLEYYGGDDASVNYEMKAFVLEVFGVVHYRCGDIVSAQNALEACLELATGYTPPVEAPTAAVLGQSSPGALEWNADGRYNTTTPVAGGTAAEVSASVAAVTPQQPILGLGMPVASYFLSAVYSSVHSQLKHACDADRKTRRPNPSRDMEERAYRKQFATAATILLRRAMDEGWNKLVDTDTECAAELWRTNWEDVELRQIAAWV